MAFCADDERNLLKDIQKITRQTIPAFDRRNDRGLTVMTKAMPEPTRGERQARPQGRPGQGQPHRGGHAPKRNRNHADAKPGHRQEGRPENRPQGEGAAKPAFKGPRSRRRGGGGGGGRSQGASGVWSNR